MALPLVHNPNEGMARHGLVSGAEIWGPKRDSVLIFRRCNNQTYLGDGPRLHVYHVPRLGNYDQFLRARVRGRF